MKLAYTRIVSNDAPHLGKFYRQLTGVAQVGNEDYVAFETAGGTLALSSERAAGLCNAGAAVAGSNRSVIIEFAVADVDRERARLSTIVREFALKAIDQPCGNRSTLFRPSSDPDQFLCTDSAGQATLATRPFPKEMTNSNGSNE